MDDRTELAVNQSYSAHGPFNDNGNKYFIRLDKPVVHVETKDGTHIYYLVRSGYKHIYPGQMLIPPIKKSSEIITER